jgi:hypothetical protein
MKQIILIFAILLLIGCKKEDFINPNIEIVDGKEVEVIYEEVVDSIIETDEDVKYLHPELEN